MNHIEALARALVIMAGMEPDKRTTDARPQWFHMQKTANELAEALDALGFAVVSKMPLAIPNDEG